MNFLITGSAGDIAQSIATILKQHYTDCKLIGCDIHTEYISADLFEKTYVLPRASSTNYLYALNNVIEDNDVDVLIPASEPELRFFAQNFEFIKSLPCHTITACLSAMQIGFDKLLTANHLSQNHLPSPWSIPSSDTSLGAPEIPCIYKSRTGSGSSTVLYIDDYNKSLLYQKLFPEYIWQQYLPATNGEFTCGVYRCSAAFTRVIIFKRRLTSGLTTFAQVVNRPEIELLCSRISDSLDLRGSINIQIRYLDEETPMVFEINPRFSSTVGMRHKVGFSDLIWSIQETVFGESLPPCSNSWPLVKLGKRYQELLL